MSSPLLTTKLHIPPVRPELITRPRLVRRLNAGLHRKLTLISAPAGFGKTTLLSEWARRRGEAPPPREVAWLSLDEEDNDQTRFWTYLVAALQTAHAELGEDVLRTLKAAQPPPAQAVLVPLLNDIATLPGGVLLVLDDYHLISSRAIHDAVAFLLQHQPQQLHLVLSTRADPPLPTSRLRARGQVAELRADDLRFTPDEAAAFLHEAMGLSLTPEDVQALEARTEGWIVGLQLAALSLQGRSDAHAFIQAFTGSHHYVLEYLVEEVVQRQPESVQEFLLQTSILDRMTGPLCDAVVDVAAPGGQRVPETRFLGRNPVSSQESLEYLRRNNLFVIPLDEEHRWYRYHHLFADLLGNLLRQASCPERISELHHRASTWYEENGMASEAIRHALQGGDYERAASLIERAIKATLSRGSVRTLLRWSEALPEAVVRTRPRLRMYQGWAMFLNARLPLARPMLQEARIALQAMPPCCEKDALRGELAAMLATISVVEQEIPRAIAEAEEALACLPEDDLVSRARATRALGVAHGSVGDTNKAIQTCSEARALALRAGNLFLAAEITSQLAAGHAHQGRLRQAARTYREIAEMVEPPARFPPAGLGYIGLAEISLEWNDLDAVEDYLNRGIELCQQGGIGYNLRSAYFTQAMLRQAIGDTAGALEAIRKAGQFDPAIVLLERAVHLASYQARLQLLMGDVQMAWQWAKGENVIPHVSFERLPVFLREIQQVSLARVYLAQDAPESVLETCAHTCAQAQAAGRMARVIELSLLQALALQMQSKPDAALVPFERCLSLAEPEGYVRLFLEAGKPAVTLLHQAASRGISPEYAGKLLEAFQSQVPGVVPASRGPSTPQRVDSEPQAQLIEPLTRRELEVLDLIRRGYSNQEIARSLVVTLHTVKKHTSNIYGKLGVHSRTQAVARAQRLGLL